MNSKDTKNKNTIYTENVLERTLTEFKKLNFDETKITKLVNEILQTDDVKVYTPKEGETKPQKLDSNFLNKLAETKMAIPTREYLIKGEDSEFIANLKMTIKKEDIVNFLSRVFLFTANMEIIKKELDVKMKEFYGTEMTMELYFLIFINQLTFTTLSTSELNQDNPINMIMEGLVLENFPIKNTLQKVFGKNTIEAFTLLGINCMSVTAEILLEQTNRSIAEMQSQEYQDKLAYYASEEYKKDIEGEK